VRVLLREGLGSEVVVHARLDGRAPAAKAAQGEHALLGEGDGVAIIARLDPRTTVGIDTDALLTVELERLHFFDPETGRSIRS
jgi:hypothetical protein